MKILQKLVSFMIHSSIWVAVSVFALTWITLLVLARPFDPSVMYFNLYGSILGYNVIKYFSVIPNMQWKKKETLFLLVLNLFALLMVIYYFVQLSNIVKLAGGISLLLCILYIKPLFGTTLRIVPGLKLKIVALVWAIVTVLLPSLQVGNTLDSAVILLFIQRILFVYVITLPFEIRDLKEDAPSLATIPQTIGVAKTKKLGMVLISLFFLLTFFIQPISEYWVLSVLGVYFLVMLALYHANEEQTPNYSSFWVESLSIFWLILFLVLQFFLK